MLVVRGRVFHRNRLEPLSVGIEAGRIVAVKKLLEGDEVLDAGHALVLPGAIDLHVHLREPGLTHKDDFPNGTRSAALGGITTVLDMPNTKPPVTSQEVFEAKMALVRGRAAVDYGIYAAPGTGSSARSLVGATAFKAYMAESTGDLQIEEGELASVLAAAADLGTLVAVHAEDPRAIRKEPGRDLQGHGLARPKEAEVRAVKTLAALRGRARVHVAHVTCVEALDAIPAEITTEVTPHHLFLDATNPLGAFGKVNPPLRSREDREALWKAFVDGRVDLVASDHAPHTREEKEEGPFSEAPAGLPGVGTSLPLLLRQVKAGNLGLDRLVRAMAERPADLLGLPKGRIDVGRDADLVLVDPRRVTKVTAKRLRYKCGWTPFEGMEACFPDRVLVRGEVVIEGGEAVAEGIGKLVAPARKATEGETETSPGE